MSVIDNGNASLNRHISINDLFHFFFRLGIFSPPITFVSSWFVSFFLFKWKSVGFGDARKLLCFIFQMRKWPKLTMGGKSHIYFAEKTLAETISMANERAQKKTNLAYTVVVGGGGAHFLFVQSFLSACSHSIRIEKITVCFFFFLGFLHLFLIFRFCYLRAKLTPHI